MKDEQRLEQVYDAGAKKIFEKYGEFVSLENCKKILIEEKGNTIAAEQRVAKWAKNKFASMVTRLAL